jgi:hypothetical protein
METSDNNEYSTLLDNVIAAEIEVAKIITSIDENKLQIEILTIEAANILDDVIPKLENEKKLHAAAK